MSKDLKGILICIGIVIFFIAFATTLFFTSTVFEIKTKIKQELYLRDQDHYQDEYVDLWFDLHHNKYFNDINHSCDVYTDEKGVIELEKMNAIIDKLINLYGKDFQPLIPQYPLSRLYIDENKNLCSFDMNTLSYLKLKCEEAINTNKKLVELNKEREALNNKIVYGKD